MRIQATLGDVEFITDDYLAGNSTVPESTEAALHGSDKAQRRIWQTTPRLTPGESTLGTKKQIGGF